MFSSVPCLRPPQLRRQEPSPLALRFVAAICLASTFILRPLPSSSSLSPPELFCLKGDAPCRLSVTTMMQDYVEFEEPEVNMDAEGEADWIRVVEEAAKAGGSTGCQPPWEITVPGEASELRNGSAVAIASPLRTAASGADNDHKRRRLLGKQTTESSPSSSAQGSLPSPRVALPLSVDGSPVSSGAEPLAAPARLHERDGEQQRRCVDWRNKEEVICDYRLAERFGRRLHYNECKTPETLSGQLRKEWIKKDWCGLSWTEKRVFHARAAKELELTRSQAAAIDRFLKSTASAWARHSDGDGKPKQRSIKRSNDWLLKVKQVFLTYHSDSWVLNRPEWDLPAAEPLAAAVSLSKQDPEVVRLQHAVLHDAKAIVEKLHVAEWSVALELCPETWADFKKLRLHVHALFTWPKQQRLSARALILARELPSWHNDANPLSIVRSRNTAPGHYYLQMPNVGSVWCGTNTPAFKKFSVNPRWVTTFWQSGHLTIASARAEYVKCKGNLIQNLANHDVVARETLASALHEKKRIISEALRAEMVEFRHVPQKEPFLEQFEHISNRYKFMVVHGESGTGKTVWARWLFGDPQFVLEVNCASCPEPDLRDLDPLLHKAILYDEASPEMVLRQKKLFQAPPASVRLGCSTTNCHAYDVFVSGVAMIIASNTWVSDVEALKKPEDRRWLADNSFVVSIGYEKLFKSNSTQ